MARLRLIDDPNRIAELARHAFPSRRTASLAARRVAVGVNFVAAAPPGVVLLNLRVPDGPRPEAFEVIQATT